MATTATLNGLVRAGFTHIVFGIGLLIGVAGFWFGANSTSRPAEAHAPRPAASLALELRVEADAGSAPAYYVVLVSTEEERSLLEALLNRIGGDIAGRSVAVTTIDDLERVLIPVRDTAAMGAAPYRLVDPRGS